jgi:hypothetical protein
MKIRTRFFSAYSLFGAGIGWKDTRLAPMSFDLQALIDRCEAARHFHEETKP